MILSQTPCPGCNEAGGLYIDSKFVASPIGSASLAGFQMKTTARLVPILKCSNCPLHLTGSFDGDDHVVFGKETTS